VVIVKEKEKKMMKKILYYRCANRYRNIAFYNGGIQIWFPERRPATRPSMLEVPAMGITEQTRPVPRIYAL
jgi:hypothetical protein